MSAHRLKTPVGTIRKGRDIGKQPYSMYIVAVCPECGKARWVEVRYWKKKPYRLCIDCSYAAKVRKLIAGKKEAAKRLTSKQRQVLVLMSQGLPTKQIAIKMGVSFNTTAHMRDRIYKKLDVDNRVSAVMKLMHGEVK